MKQAFAGSILVALSGAVLGQPTTTPTFDLADVHVSPPSLRAAMLAPVLRGTRYQLMNATMLDLIRTAYTVDPDKILSGPRWLEQDRYDIIAKAPQGSSADTLKLMLQALLADRFKLVFRRDTHPLPAFALTVGKGGHKLQEADGTEEPGCKFVADTQQQIAKADAQLAAARATAADNNSGGFAIMLQPTYTYTCGNTTMAAFAEAMHTMPAAATYFGTGIIVDQTGLKGNWDISFKYTTKPPTAPAAAAGNALSIITLGASQTILLFDAVDKQLGLKLDPITFATPVIVVESVNRKPTDNPPGVTTNLPPSPAAEFEVADLRLSAPGSTTSSGNFQNTGRVDLRNFPLLSLVNQTLNASELTGTTIVGMPKWLTAAVRVDLTAKLPLTGGLIAAPVMDEYRPALRALLAERFKLAYHIEQRPADAYNLVAAKPKLKPAADPLLRSTCKDVPIGDAKDPRTANPINGRLITCVNTTMADLAQQLPRLAAAYVRTDVIDTTGLDGAYDFTLNFAGSVAAVQNGTGARLTDAAPAGGPAAGTTDPNGAISLFDALGKLGLKLDLQKRPQPVIVIDHLDEKPADN